MKLTQDELNRIEEMSKRGASRSDPRILSATDKLLQAMDPGIADRQANNEAELDHLNAATQAAEDHEHAANEANEDHAHAANEAAEDHANAAHEAEQDHANAANEANEDHENAAHEVAADHAAAAEHDEADHDAGEIRDQDRSSIFSKEIGVSEDARERIARGLKQLIADRASAIDKKRG